ncbi:hypothetical protein SAICODRAFT_8716 [Saitoella complicata NRRL Y-17804]|uniref:Myb-like domain-containing protein n=1 Tax=Saitoella complicata (strain BCRC 22490 / CBS 7301 / JCM 7358 / NBRC 10748 / NRRL Y-17804) TaxID=698492 RepID=A0A0E9NNN5_SAICN|nr:uncharacterized protein SAICODRAFT_8716 [Saitoella complicata NRRL Y-17804]ODQ51789.1 hypothetical protein SAICODRAFT_8716 [Saitoella complicata NRRL Y-17804]GAO51408.1 hypothetical protein G7K_5510-t1 [Saitoella complicata NRRL Y-17804]
MGKAKKEFISDEEEYDHGNGSHKHSGVGTGNGPRHFWTEEELEQIRLWRELNKDWEEIAQEFPGTTVNSIKLQHRKAVANAGAVAEWTPEDMDLLVKAYKENRKEFYLKVAAATGRGWLTCEDKIVELGKEVTKGYRA